MKDKLTSVVGEITDKRESKNKNGELFYKYTVEFGDKKMTVNSKEGAKTVGDKVAWMVRESEYEFNGQMTTSRWYVQEAAMKDGEMPTSLEDTVYQMYEDLKEVKEMVRKLVHNPVAIEDEQLLIDDALEQELDNSIHG